MDDLPLLSCGKVNRKALQEKYTNDARLREIGKGKAVFLTVSYKSIYIKKDKIILIILIFTKKKYVWTNEK